MDGRSNLVLYWIVMDLHLISTMAFHEEIFLGVDCVRQWLMGSIYWEKVSTRTVAEITFSVGRWGEAPQNVSGRRSTAERTKKHCVRFMWMLEWWSIERQFPTWKHPPSDSFLRQRRTHKHQSQGGEFWAVEICPSFNLVSFWNHRRPLEPVVVVEGWKRVWSARWVTEHWHAWERDVRKWRAHLDMPCWKSPTNRLSFLPKWFKPMHSKHNDTRFRYSAKKDKQYSRSAVSSGKHFSICCRFSIEKSNEREVPCRH